MKTLVLNYLVLIFTVVLLLSAQAFAAPPTAQQNPRLEIQTLSESLNGLSEDEKLSNVRLFLKSSGENWENVQSCGGAGILAKDRYNRTSCGLDYSSLSGEIVTVLIRARVAIGAELQKIFLNGSRNDRRVVFNNLISCQRRFADGIDANLNCYLKLLPDSAPQKEHALSVVRESAILTLLLERNEKPPCFKVPDLSENEKENYQVGTFMSPLFDQDKEMNFDIGNYVCDLRKDLNWSNPQ